MAIAISSASDENKRLEIFSLIWLDANPNETRQAEPKIRSVINYLRGFHQIKECQEYIEQTSEKDRLVLIVSGQLGREIVPLIHQLRQVISIYIYCFDKRANKKWSSKYSKVKAVVTDLDELITRITDDHKVQKKLEEPLSINIFSTNTGGKSTTGLNGQFVFSQVLIDCLLRLKSNQTDRNELIDICEKEYQTNARELSYLQEFKQTYVSRKALWWYTRESFFYKTLNAALRTENIHMIFLFRSIIFDIQQQLQQYQSNQVVQVYRGQIISNEELNNLTKSIGQFISINSFFSTSTDYSKASSFLNRAKISDDLQKVLFEIDADPEMVTTKPFADISKHSYYPKESEVLFMIGSIFRLKKIFINDNQIWIIRMSLCNDDQNELKEVLQYMKQQTGNGQTNLRILSKVLWKMGQLDLAEKYLKRLLNELSANDPLLLNLYEDLGELSSLRGQFDISVEWHQKALAFKSQNLENEQSNGSQTNKAEGKTISSNPISFNTKWTQQAITIAGGNGKGDELNQLYCPSGMYVDNDQQSIYIADCQNHCIVGWKLGASNGQVVAGGNAHGSQSDQLNTPTDVIMDKTNHSLIICDMGNRRVVRWPCQNGEKGEIIISDIDCCGVTMDQNGNLYVSDYIKNEVKLWKKGEKEGRVVAGGNGKGNCLNQLNFPTYLFVDDEYSVYVSDQNNHCVMKWVEGAKEGIVVAGGQGQGESLRQLSHPRGVVVDALGRVYVADSWNHRIMCWSSGSTEGRIIVGGNGQGQEPNQFSYPEGLLFDGEHNLYVADHYNHRIQKFVVDGS